MKRIRGVGRSRFRGGRLASEDTVRDARSAWTPDWARRYWEQRAQRFARIEDGLPAVCSFGMPRFYNAYIQATQRRALAPFLHVGTEDRVLDVGSGVGRWSLQMAASGADVTGVDLSQSMVAEASRRAAARGLSSRCRFLERDLAELELAETFSRIVVVTVLQHILDEGRLGEAIARLQHPGIVQVYEVGTFNGCPFFALEYVAVRFNFRGIGRSQGEFDHGTGELSDAAAALDHVGRHRPGRTRKADERPRLGNVEIAEHREAGGDAAGCRVGEH